MHAEAQVRRERESARARQRARARVRECVRECTLERIHTVWHGCDVLWLGEQAAHEEALEDLAKEAGASARETKAAKKAPSSSSSSSWVPWRK